MAKIGRNEPCPCGSGKKYKNCCLQKDNMQFGLPEDLITGTPLDDYFYLLEGVGIFAGTLNAEKKKILLEASEDFNRRFKPDEVGGIPLSYFTNWLYFDFRFGKSQQTLCERFIISDTASKLNKQGQTYIKHLSNSYFTFYEVMDVSDDRIIFKELGTAKKWTAIRIDEQATPGEIWYVRLIGIPKESYIFSAHYIYPQEIKKMFVKTVNAQKKSYAEYEDKNSKDIEVFRNSCKASHIFWIENILTANGIDVPSPKEYPPMKVINKDRDPITFLDVRFKIIEKKGLEEKMNTISNFDFDKQSNNYIWYKVKGGENIILGSIYIKGEYLVGETDSLQRALKLKNKLKQRFGKYLCFEEIVSKDLQSMPPLTKKQQEEISKEKEELYSNPEIREFLKNKAEDYYHNKWMRHKIPALDNKTPKQAMKTKEGRRKVEELLNGLEQMQNANPDDPYKVDVNELRKRLGIL